MVSYANAEEGIRVVSDQSSVCKSFCVKPVYSSLLSVFAIVLSFLVAKEKEKKKRRKKMLQKKNLTGCFGYTNFFYRSI